MAFLHQWLGKPWTSAKRQRFWPVFSVIHLPLLCMIRINVAVSGFFAFAAALCDVLQASIKRFQMVDHRVHAQAEQLQRRLATGQVPLLRGHGLPLLRAAVAKGAAGGQPYRPQPRVQARLQQAWVAADQHAAVQAFAVQRHQGLPAGVRRRPAHAVHRMPRQPGGQYMGQALALGGVQVVQPDAWHLALAQAGEGGQGAGGGRGGAIIGGLHQAAAQAEQHSGEGGCSVHGNFPQIVRRLFGDCYHPVTAGAAQQLFTNY
ncbi:protein of unknown function [Pseudomonas sp. JV551A1]|nr:protein of unknown function [Pseudomonas sp. JV551A1]